MPRLMALASFAAPLAIAVLAVLAAADSRACNERKSVIEPLKDAHAEEPIGIVMGLNGSVIELLRGTSGSWTILMTPSAGVTCIIAAGESWEAVARKQTAW